MGFCELLVRCTTPALEYHLAVYEREWGGWVLPGSHGSVVSALHGFPDIDSEFNSSGGQFFALSLFSLSQQFNFTVSFTRLFNIWIHVVFMCC